jgi:hypothetical protein
MIHGIGKYHYKWKIHIVDPENKETWEGVGKDGSTSRAFCFRKEVFQSCEEEG